MVAVIHQPSYETFSLFDDLVLLAKGGLTAYCGPQQDVQVWGMVVSLYHIWYQTSCILLSLSYWPMAESVLCRYGLGWLPYGRFGSGFWG